MRFWVASILSFLGGFAVMVLEIIGVRFVARDFGSSLYVWVNQIGVVLAALALGYFAGGALADRYGRMRVLGALLIPAGLMAFLIPDVAGRLMDALISRHPLDRPIPPLWQILDPVLGSLFIFLLPCSGLASLSPYLIRVSAHRLAQVGRMSGWIIAFNTVGGIVGVFVSGYVLLEFMSVPHIFRATGALTVGMGLLCVVLDRWFARGDLLRDGSQNK
jgi:MFS family permease